MRRKEIRKLLAERDGRECHYCGTKLGLGKSARRRTNIDHIVPQSQGGSDDLDNLLLSCRTCNTRKGDKPYEKYIREELKRVRKHLETLEKRV